MAELYCSLSTREEFYSVGVDAMTFGGLYDLTPLTTRYEAIKLEFCTLTYFLAVSWIYSVSSSLDTVLLCRLVFLGRIVAVFLPCSLSLIR